MRVGKLEIEDLLLLSAVLLLPWAFGGVELWAFRTAALLIVAAATVAWTRHGAEGLGLDRRARWLLPAALLAVWAAFQLVPLPPTLVRVMSPGADEIYRQAFPGYGGESTADPRRAIEERALELLPEVDGLGQPARPVEPFEPRLGGRWSGWRPLHLAPAAGVERLHWYVALLLAFLVARARTRSRERARDYRTAFFALFLGLAVFGLVDAAAGNGKLYWIRAPLYQARPFGPYVNPTNFAGVMELALPWVSGTTLLLMRRSRDARTSSRRSPLYGATALLCLLAGLATASKSAVLLLGAGLALIVVAAMRGTAARVLATTGMAAAAVVGWLLLRGQLLGERMRQFAELTAGGYEEVGRIVAWKAALPMLGEFSAVGVGFGAFREVYPRYMPPGEIARWAQLHNDWLQVLVEGGWVVAPLLGWLLWGFWSRLLRRSNLLAGDGVDLEALGLAAGLLLLSVHAAFDFNHQIPANALLFVVIGALAVSRAERGRKVMGRSR